ncbi:platelet-activating factor acetylhydrolase-like [Tribolium madens]|uniref:platelet-activating factor acetylhydrolase-like n=1 Tax=Tribolium madens TaxID=41895 RepID=UPI001CF73F6C|nr:platelet-activating factor acetylhydrolase-like [Tribolium madens]
MWWLWKSTNNLPEATGPFTPGCMDVMLEYSQNGIFMRLYYPTNEAKKDPRNFHRFVPWIPSASYFLGLSKVLMIFPFIIRFVYWWCHTNIVPALYGSRPKTDQKLKCVVLSHGLGGYRSLYSNTCCELASRGFLVAALEHRDGSSCYTYYYKSKEDARNQVTTDIEYEPFILGKTHHKQRKRQVEYRAKECGQVLDFLIDLNNGKVPHNVVCDVPSRREIDFDLGDFVGKLDLETITMAGHSFGGATALLALHQRREFKQGVLLDPWMYPIKDDGLEAKITQPLVFINTQTFHIMSNVSSMAKFLTSDDRTMFTILHTTHENQTDSALVVGYWLNWFMKKLEPVVALKINNSLILVFLDKLVKCLSDVTDCREFLKEQESNLEQGLTRPWI